MTATARTAAETLNVSLSTVYRRCRNGKLDAAKVNGRWIITLTPKGATMAELTGTDKQITWAAKIRDEATSWIRTTVDNESLREHYLAVAARITDASWWLDHRHYIQGPAAYRPKNVRDMIRIAMTDDERQTARDLAKRS